MHGPEQRGPTFARRLIDVARVGLSIIILFGVAFAMIFWNAIRRDGQPRTALQGNTRALPLPSSSGTGEAAARAEPSDGATIEQAIAASAFVVVDLSNGRAVREQKSEWLDTPVWPGSIAKLATFAAAIDAGVLTDATRITCARRVMLPDLRRVDCSHPPLGHPMSPVEALANSCNVFTATIARGLTREQLSSGFVRMGLSPVPAGGDLLTSALGLGGAQVAPRRLIEAVRRAANIPLVREGLRASARTGTSASFGAVGIEALAKTGTAPMRGGRALGLVAAITPADSPRLGIVVALPGGSGAQAAETAAAILRSLAPSSASSPRTRDTLGRGSRDERGERGEREQGGYVNAWTRSPVLAADRMTSGPRHVLWSGRSAGERAGGQRESSRAGARASDASRGRAASVVRIGQPTAKGYDVEALDVEEYVARVVAGETSDATPAAAREALAITARTFALVNRERHASDGFDLCTLTHCQVTRPATRSSRAAAERTRGQVLVDARVDAGDGVSSRLAPVFYSASCGGTIADARSLLANGDGATMPWLAARPDPAGVEELAWQTDITADDLLYALQQSGSRGDTLRNLIAHGGGAAPASGDSVARVRTPTPSTPGNLGRRGAANSERGGGSGDGSGSRDGSGAAATRGFALVTHITTEGLTPSTLAIDDFRRAIGQQLGWHLLKSTRFTVQRRSSGYRFNGRGHGHGVGLCVFGASTLAARGADATRIIEAYFPGLQAASSDAGLVSSAPQAGRPAAANSAVRSSATGATAGRAEAANASNAANARVAAAVAIKLRLPSRDESERARLLRLISTNLKELTLDLSLPSPPALDVIVHPTVDAYRRATKSPSWTSAATILANDEITLHFAPLSSLDRGAMLTQTVRHELVHVLTLRALFDRPRWVHEGLALHLAGERVSVEPEETSADRDRVKCPSDRDLMRPRSRDAFDRAYSRAAACVARDLSAGRNWRDLGAR